MSLFTFLLILTVRTNFLFVDHALYLSVAEVVHANNSAQASIKIKVFTNDMEDAIENEFQTRINLSDTLAFQDQKEVVEKYFANHFTLSVDSKKVSLAIAKSQLVGDAIWFYFKGASQSKWKAVTITADYLMELFPTQSNVH